MPCAAATRTTRTISSYVRIWSRGRNAYSLPKTSAGMQYGQRKLQRSVTEMRRSRSGRPSRSFNCATASVGIRGDYRKWVGRPQPGAAGSLWTHLYPSNPQPGTRRGCREPRPIVTHMRPGSRIFAVNAKMNAMATYKVADAAGLLGVSPDPVRRWLDSGRLQGKQTMGGGRRLIDGKELARFAETLASAPTAAAVASESTRNRFTGIVTRVVRDKVMAQVEVQAGPYRMVSLIS